MKKLEKTDQLPGAQLSNPSEVKPKRKKLCILKSSVNSPRASRGSFGFRPLAFFRSSAFGLWVFSILFVALSPIHAQTVSDETLAQIRFEQKLNDQISLALPFRDEQGNQVLLGQYFGRKPVLLVLGYYECPMLCTLVLNGMVESAADMKWSIGPEFEVVNISINPVETPTLALAKKRTYLKRYGRSGAADGWHFLTGSAAAIRQIADEVGFRYAYDPASKQYAHPSGLVVLTPQGTVSRYLFGVTYSSRELYNALNDASGSKVGSPIQQLILLCFHYNPITGKYSGLIIVVLRLLAVVTMLGFLSLIFALVRRGQSARASLAASATQLSGSSSTEAQILCSNTQTDSGPETVSNPPQASPRL